MTGGPIGSESSRRQGAAPSCHCRFARVRRSSPTGARVLPFWAVSTPSSRSLTSSCRIAGPFWSGRICCNRAKCCSMPAGTGSGSSVASRSWAFTTICAPRSTVSVAGRNACPTRGRMGCRNPLKDQAMKGVCPDGRKAKKYSSNSARGGFPEGSLMKPSAGLAKFALLAVLCSAGRE